MVMVDVRVLTSASEEPPRTPSTGQGDPSCPKFGRRATLQQLIVSSKRLSTEVRP